MLTKSILCMSLGIFTYWYGVVQGQLWAGCLMGILLAVWGLSVMHDASHGALSTSPTVNRIFSFVSDLTGGSAFSWRHQHVVAHHSDPNDAELDVDTYNNYPLLRLNPALPHLPHHRWQFLYAPVLFAFLGPSMTVNDFVCLLSMSYAHVRFHKMRPVDVALFVLGKLTHFGLFYAVPMYLHGISAIWRILMPVFGSGSLFIAICFLVSHNSEGVEYNVPHSVNWGELQVRTSVNWAIHGDPETPWLLGQLWLYASGGLNYQIEHHLFPGVCHMHYPALSRIVRQL